MITYRTFDRTRTQWHFFRFQIFRFSANHALVSPKMWLPSDKWTLCRFTFVEFIDAFMYLLVKVIVSCQNTTATLFSKTIKHNFSTKLVRISSKVTSPDDASVHSTPAPSFDVLRPSGGTGRSAYHHHESRHHYQVTVSGLHGCVICNKFWKFKRYFYFFV